MSARAQVRLALCTPTVTPRCRTAGCPLPQKGLLGFCAPCEAVYVAARALREQLLTRRGALLHAAHRELFDALAPLVRAELLAHLAARAADRGMPPHGFAVAGLDDFLAELRDLGLAGKEPA